MLVCTWAAQILHIGNKTGTGSRGTIRIRGKEQGPEDKERWQKVDHRDRRLRARK